MATQAETVQDWKTLQGVSKDEFTKNMSKGAYDKFLNDQGFVDSAIKSDKLFEKPSDPKPTEPTPVIPPLNQPAPEPPKPPVQDGPKWWAKEGYASEEEAVGAFNNLREIADKKQEQIDRYNAERGTYGKERLAEKQRITQLETELRAERERVKPSGSGPATLEIPNVPVAPTPIDGNYESPEFKANVINYQKDVAVYNEKMRTLLSRPADTTKLERELAELKSKTASFEQVTQEQIAERNRVQTAEQWQKTMSEVAKVQEYDSDLKTSKPFDEINSFVRTRGYDEAAKIYPKKDIENFDRICDIIKETYNVDAQGSVDFTSVPKHRTLKAAYINLLDSKGKLDDLLNKVREQGARAGREQVVKAIAEQGSHAQVLPIGGQGGDIVNELVSTDVDRDLLEFDKPENAYLWKSTDPKDADRQKKLYDTLMRKAEKDPSWRSLIPTSWLTKFSKG